MFLATENYKQNKLGILAGIWITIFILATNFWIVKDNRPPAWDQAYYLTGAESLYQTLRSGNLSRFLSESTTVYGRKAPLIAYIPLPFFLLFGSSYSLALSANLLFYIPFAIFFYKFISEVRNSKIALMSLIFASTMPLFYGLSRNYFVEFGLMSIFFAWLYVHLRSENFSNKKYTLLIGILTGLGMLMKFHFFVLIATPITYSLWVRRHQAMLFARDFIFLLLPAMAVSLPWYSRNIITVLWHAKRATSPELLGSYYYGNPFSLPVVSRVTSEIINYALSPYYMLLFVILTVIILYKGLVFKIKWPFVLYFFIPFLIFFFGPNKDYRLLLPLLPFFAYFLAALFDLATRGKPNFFVISILIPILFFLFFCVPLRINKKVEIGGLLLLGDNIGTYVEKPKSGNFPNDEIVKYILQSSKKTHPVLISSYENEYLNINNLNYLTLKNGGRLKVKTVSYSKDLSEIQEILLSGDYLITMDSDHNLLPELNRNNKYILELLKSPIWKKMNNKFVFPDGSKALIYEKISI